MGFIPNTDYSAFEATAMGSPGGIMQGLGGTDATYSSGDAWVDTPHGPRLSPFHGLDPESPGGKPGTGNPLAQIRRLNKVIYSGQGNQNPGHFDMGMYGLGPNGERT